MDITAKLPEGGSYKFWEQKQSYEHELHVDCNQIGVCDENDLWYIGGRKGISY